ncbi:MAG TPA: DinB family protein, partial [Thermoanaerobaculia bacterium]
MSRRIGIVEAAADHRAAIEALSRLVESQDPALWAKAPAPGKWSPAEIAQHLLLSYEVVEAELAGGPGFRIVLPWWKRLPLRWAVLPKILAGRFPKGAPAPRESRPRTGAASPAEAARILRAHATRLEEHLADAGAIGRVRVAHPYFGRVTVPQMLKLAAVHAAHHG